MSSAESLPSPETVLSDNAWHDPAPLLARFREDDPIHWIPGLDAWFATRYDDVRLLFADTRLTADPRQWERYVPPTPGEPARWLSEMPFRSKPSDPRMLGRRLVSTALTPRAVTLMEQRVEEVVEEFAAPLRGRTGVVDVMGEFTGRVAVTVIGRILGVPPKGDDAERFRQLASGSARGINPVMSEKKRLKTEKASVEMAEYILGLVEERRREPREDLISDLVRASDSAVPATVEDIVRVISGLVSAGTITVGHASTRSIRALLQHPDQLALLRGDRSLLSNAVGELLRYHSGLIAMPRFVVEELEVRGKKLLPGQLVILSIAGANHDPRAFENPERLDLTRDTKASMSFGHGRHYCIGANLAYVQLRHILDAALDFLPENARLLEDQIRWSERGMQSRIKTLPVDFGS